LGLGYQFDSAIEVVVQSDCKVLKLGAWPETVIFLRRRVDVSEIAAVSQC
jgi:hypothetical protein